HRCRSSRRVDRACGSTGDDLGAVRRHQGDRGVFGGGSGPGRGSRRGSRPLEPSRRVSTTANAKPLRPLREEITDLPNIITLIRIGIIPLILIWIDNYSKWLSVISTIIFIIAAASDVLDGYLARRMGLVTVVGKFLDPLADKLIVLSTLVMLVAKGRAPAW